jgi:hypothetical protein
VLALTAERICVFAREPLALLPSMRAPAPQHMQTTTSADRHCGRRRSVAVDRRRGTQRSHSQQRAQQISRKRSAGIAARVPSPPTARHRPHAPERQVRPVKLLDRIKKQLRDQGLLRDQVTAGRSSSSCATKWPLGRARTASSPAIKWPLSDQVAAGPHQHREQPGDQVAAGPHQHREQPGPASRRSHSP